VLSPFGAEGGFTSYERTYPPCIIAVAAEARSFYVEFRARDEVGGFGHSYVTLGAIIAVAAEARSFYVEFRARDEVGGFGHSYVTLGAINAVGEVRETVAAGRIAGAQFPLNSTSFCTLPAYPTSYRLQPTRPTRPR